MQFWFFWVAKVGHHYRAVRQGCVFSPDLFSLNDAILRELETVLGFIIDGPNLNNIRYTNGTVLVAVSVEKNYRAT